MKKIIFCAMLLIGFTGCSTISEYNKGCRAGINGWNHKPNQKEVDDYCSDLDQINKALENAGRARGGRG